MMLNIRLDAYSSSIIGYIPVSGIVALVLLLQFSLLLYTNFSALIGGSEYVQWQVLLDAVPSVKLLGELLYTTYYYAVVLAGLLLLVSMVGAVVLTLHHRTDVKRQIVYQQISRQYNNLVTYK
jgi:NADH-quinone oxidoreductase subunit J